MTKFLMRTIRKIVECNQGGMQNACSTSLLRQTRHAVVRIRSFIPSKFGRLF